MTTIEISEISYKNNVDSNSIGCKIYSFVIFRKLDCRDMKIKMKHISTVCIKMLLY